MIDFRYSPVEQYNKKQRILHIPRMVKLSLKRNLYSTFKSLNNKDIILKRNFVRYII